MELDRHRYVKEAESDDVPRFAFSPPSESAAIGEKTPDLLYLPGHQGVPVRGAPSRILAPEELQRFQLSIDVHFRIFDLQNPDQLRQYETLMTAAASFPWVRVYEEVKPADIGAGSTNWKVGVKWGETYLQPPVTGVFRVNTDPLGV